VFRPEPPSYAQNRLFRFDTTEMRYNSAVRFLVLLLVSTSVIACEADGLMTV
jgi:hypothetical protein